MLKKTLFLAAILSSFAYAETCPTVHEIRSNNFNGWNAYTIDNGTPLSSDELQKFKSRVLQFALAEWMPEAPEGESHCYYLDKHSHDSSLVFAYLAKHDLIAEKSTYWQDKGGETLQCFHGIMDCRFIHK